MSDTHKLDHVSLSNNTFFVQLVPEDTEEFIEYLKSIGRLDEAATKLAEIVNRVRSCDFFHGLFNFIFLVSEGKFCIKAW